MAGSGAPHVVIVGGGFGGLACARALKDAPLRITLVDRSNFHLFQPLLYQVATAALSPGDVAAPIRSILRGQENAEVVLADVRRIDVAARRLELEPGAGDPNGSLDYDALVLAAGATHSYFGHDEWAALAPGLKTIGDALAIRGRILRAFERAEREPDDAQRRRWLTFVVIGGGPTGVELAGALSEIARETLVRDFRRIDPRQARVVLIEAAPRVLQSFVPELSESARIQLTRLGVEVRLGAKVTAVDKDGVALAGMTSGGTAGAATHGDERLDAKTVLWAAGVAASPLARSLGVPLDRAGRVLVGPTLEVPGLPRHFVIGDLAAVQSDGKSVPGVAPAAMQMGRHAALNLRRSFDASAPLLPFRYRDQGSLATIGRAAAVAEIGRLRWSGLPAWLLWTVIHIFQLVGFRNRVLVMLQWAWLWVTKGRGVRLITTEGTGGSDST